MNGRIILEVNGKEVILWFNNYSKVEIGKSLLLSVNGFDPRPEEEKLIKAIDEMAKDNYLKLIKVLINAGVIGYAYGTDSTPALKSKDIAEFIATAESAEIYNIWRCFLQAYGFDLLFDEEAEGKLTEDEKKKQT